MARLAQGVEPAEISAALAIRALAEDLQDLLYYHGADGVAPGTVKELNRVYRVMKRAVIFYEGEGEHSLIYEAPDGKFKPKEKAC